MARKGPLSPIGSVDDPTFADDVMHVYKHLNTVPYDASVDGYTTSRGFMHEWATYQDAKGNRPYVKEFMKMASDVDERRRSVEDVREKSAKGIAQLKELLRDTLEKSKEVTP